MHRSHTRFVMFILALSAAMCVAQDASPAPSAPPEVASLPDAPDAASQSSSQSQLPSQDRNPPQPAPTPEGKQTKRILGIIPNFRSVSVDEKLPPIATRDKFKLMLEDSFDYSSFIYVAILSGVGQAENSYPEFHTGAPAYARYYWHSFTDTVSGNMMTEFILPTTTREDPRYYTLGRGGFVRRSVYSFGRLVITRTDHGNATPNSSSTTTTEHTRACSIPRGRPDASCRLPRQAG
jgi:hypothetical protein